MQEKKPSILPFRIVSQAQVPPMRSRHSAFFDALDVEIRRLPRGKALELHEKDLHMRSESVRHHVNQQQRAGGLSKEVQVICRASPTGQLCYVLMPLKADAKHE